MVPKHKLAIEILSLFEKEAKSLNRYSILGGRGSQIGSLESSLGLKFTDEERAITGEVMRKLEEKSLLSPTYSDTISPGDWLAITEKGKESLGTGALDELDELLLRLNASSDLISLKYGAHDALVSGHTDWQRHAATSSRELITKVLHTIAPDEKVLKDPYFVLSKDSKNPITRAERIKFYIRTKEGSVSSNDIKIIERACSLVESCYQKLNVVAHTDKKEVVALIELTENTLKFVLRI